MPTRPDAMSIWPEISPKLAPCASWWAMTFRSPLTPTTATPFEGAIRVGRVLEELGYVWFEEPVQHYHTASLGKVADALDIAVSAGEQEYTLQGVQRLIEAGVDIVQPDIVKTGGFTGLSDMAVLARAHGVDFVHIRPNHPSAIAPTCISSPHSCTPTIPVNIMARMAFRTVSSPALCGRWGANLCSPMRQAWDWSSLKLSCRSA